MTKIEALTDLLAKVETGAFDSEPTRPRRWWFKKFAEVYKLAFGLHNRDLEKVWDAYKGSLDAAMALHEAVLPGFFWQRQGFVMIVTNDHTGWGNGIYGKARDDTNPARAWLIAILKALIEKEKNND